jgi:hypothetical protein
MRLPAACLVIFMGQSLSHRPDVHSVETLDTGGRERDQLDLSKMKLTHQTLKSRGKAAMVLVYVNNVLFGKLLESTKLAQQDANNTKEQFASSPDLQSEIMNAIMDALDAHTLMSTQALGSEAVRLGIKDILLNHTSLWESLRAKASNPAETQR